MTTLSLHDRYDVLRPIAQGGMATVLLAREIDTGREVAVKLLAVPEGARPEEWKLRFQQEFHQTARLRHPHIVATYDYAVARDGTPFYTMEYLPGPGLEETMPLSVERVQAYLPGMLQALGAIHLQGLVHCDLKPENLRLAADGSVRLMDLGLATRAGQVAPGVQGTLPYMPPEVIRRAPVDRRSDLYALGAVLYHLLAGRPPFVGEVRDVLRGHLEQAPPPLRSLNPAVSEQLAGLVHKLLAKSPIERYQSAGEALIELGETGTLEDDASLFHAPVIGREEELGMLAAALERVKHGGYEEVWLAGDPDVGLEALLEEFCCQAQLNGATVVRGAFWARQAPFEGLRGMVRSLAALARPHGEAVDHLIPVLARVEPALGAAAPSEGADPQQERLRLFDALTQLLRLASDGNPLVMAFSQAHLASAAWKEWLEHVRRTGAQLPVLLVTTFAGEPDLDFDPCRFALDLAPVGHEQSHQACCAILGQQEIDAAFTRALHEASGGYPQRLDALLRHLVDAGHLKRARGTWQWPAGPLDGYLAGLDSNWAREQRLKTLPALALALLEALAVMGRETELYLLWQAVRTPIGSGKLSLEAALAEDGGELFEAMRVLEEGNWALSARGRVQLGPDAEREALLAWMGEARQRAAHQQIARALESLVVQTPGDTALVSELASHALAAGDRKRGPRFALEAARAQARLFALEEAEDLLRQAVALLEADPSPEPALVLGVHRLRADVARQAGDRRLALQAYERALRLANQADDLEATAGLLNGLGRLKMVTGELDEAEARFKAVLSRLARMPHHIEAAQALTLLGRLALTRGQLAEASRWVEQALNAARASGFRGLIRENMAQLGYLYVAAEEERAAEGLALLHDALQMTEKDEAKLELNTCYALLGNAQLHLGRFTEAKLAFQRNCDLCAEIGAAPHDEATAFMRRAQVELELGDYRGVRASAVPAGALARMIGNKLLLAQVRLIEGMAALYQGDFTIYQDAMLLAEESLATSESGYLKAMALTCRAEAEGFLGQWQQALSTAGQALETIAAGAGHEFSARAQLIKGEALTRLGFSKPARQALDAIAVPRNEALQARLLLAQAQLDRQDGRKPQALTLGERALTLARRAGAVPVAASCELLLARVTPHKEDALTWSRKALLDAEVCGHPALEAEALFQASRVATRSAEAEHFLSAAEEAWRRATAGLTTAIVDAFGTTEERRPLREAVKRRAAEGYRLTHDDQAALLALLAQPPLPGNFIEALVAFCRAEAHITRFGLFWEDESGVPTLVYGEGTPFGGAPSPEQELEAAHTAPDGVLIAPIAAQPGGGQPWGALLLVGVSPLETDRLKKLLPFVEGALWACRQLWLAGRAGPYALGRTEQAGEQARL